MRSPTFLPHCALGLVLAAATYLAFPPTTFAGSYAVTACFGPENASWTEWEPSPYATAYTACPGGAIDLAHPQSNEGMMVRNTGGPEQAPRGAAAALGFDAPAGTSITGLDFDGIRRSARGWNAGVQDGTHGRWLWCGAACSFTAGVWFHNELRGLATQRVLALVRCTGSPCRRDARHGLVALRNVRVLLDDPSPPAIGGVRGMLVSDRWLRGGADVAFDASDNSGIRVGRIELDGRAVFDNPRGCDFTRPVPCANGPTAATLDTRSWTDGAHALRLSAQDAGGNTTSVDRTVQTDNTAPAEPTVVLEGGEDWSPQRARAARIALPAGQAAPLVRARVRACRAGGACQESAPELSAAGAAGRAGASGTADASPTAGPDAGVATAAVAAFDGPGEYAVRVALEDAAGNVGAAAPPVTLRFDDTPPGAPDLSASDAWHNGGALPLATEGAKPASGVRGYRVRIGGREVVVTASFPLDDVAEGGTPVEVRAVSGAGVESTAVRATINLDRTRPAVHAGGVPEPGAWSREPVRIELQGHDQPALSGIATLGWRLDEGDEVSVADDHAPVEIATDGRHTLAYRATDRAGNTGERPAVTVRVDRTPPESVAFEASDPADPQVVHVVVADATSGVTGGRIELRRDGGDWTSIPTALAAGRLVARLDDAILRAGRYSLRARATDAAGNEAVGERRVDGAPVRLTLPLRRRTRLTVQRSATRLHARLTVGGRPLANRVVTLDRRLRGTTKWRTACPRLTFVVATAGCALRTDDGGRLDLRLVSGPSRTLRFQFGGDALLLPAAGSVTVRTPARAWVHAAPHAVRPGGAVRFTGHLLGGHVPHTGKLVELQARIGAGWRTFATVRANRRGDFGYAHSFAAASAGTSYGIRVRIRRETAYPFEAGASRPVIVRVV